ncbi:unnamed protein product [Cochlearia groenlandica]
MEGKTLNLYAPLPSIRRIPSKPKNTNESKKNKKTTRQDLQACPNTNQETHVYALTDQTFDHLTEPASIPFVWEQIPGKPKDDMSTLIQQSGLLETDDEEEEEQEQDSDTVTSSASFSVNCSTSGVSEIEKNGESFEDVSFKESLDLMMSRFLPASKAMAFTYQKQQSSSSSSYNSSEQKQTLINREALVTRQRSQLASEHEHFAVIQSLYDDLNIDDDDDDDDEDGDSYHDHGDYTEIIYQDVTKKACGFLPRLCAKSSFKVSNPVPLDSKLNRVLNHSGEQTGLPNWSTRRLSGFISPYRTGSLEKQQESFKRLNRGISKSQELYPTRREILPPNYSNSGEIKTFRNSISTPSRIQRTTAINDSRFLAEEVIRRRSCSTRSGNLVRISPENTAEISPPPLPVTPSRSWLRRALLSPTNPRPYGVVLGQVGAKKQNQEEDLESTKWETIVKTSYVHNDHVRYSQELVGGHPYRQQNT